MKEKKEAFFEREKRELAERNARLAERHAAKAEARAERQAARTAVVVTCMDERDFAVEEALGLLPGEASVYASGGGKIDAASFERLHGAALDEAAKAGRKSTVYLTPHECVEDGHLGCAAFANDTEAQKTFFTALKGEIEAKHPDADVHVLAFDTATDLLRPVAAKEEDASLAPMLEKNAAGKASHEEKQHAGYGIYIGDAYRAWAEDRNRWFRLSAGNPSIAGNAEIALTVMGHHSDVDLSDKPVVVQVDYPTYEDAARTAEAAANIDAQMEAFLASPAVAKKVEEEGMTIKVVKSRTDMTSWKGEILA